MLILSQSELGRMRSHAEASYPHECCGILLGTIEGDQRVVRSTTVCRNTRTDRPQDRYHVDPRDLVRVQREARELDLEILGFYHSHPDSPAQWSKTDLDEAHWIGYSYMITRVEHGVARETNSFVLTGTVEEDKHFANEELLVTQEIGNL
jgi:proteasome lid subunit RPN8/RPN11